MNKKTLTQIFSTTLSFALVVSSMPVGAAGPVGPAAPSFVAGLTPPSQFGYVSSSYAPNSSTEHPRLIILSDLHAHLEVQRNLMGILSDMVTKIKNTTSAKVPVFLEGGWQANLEEPLRGISDPQSRHFMTEYYLQKAEMGGPQAFSEKIAGSNQVSLIGVEDKEEYLANKAQFAKTYPARRQILESLKAQEVAINVLKDHLTGRSFQKLSALRDEYYAGRVSPERYAKALVRQANHFQIQSRYVATLNNVSSADPNELETAFADVYRAVSKHLSEDRPMTAFLRKQLGDEASIRTNLARVDADLDLLKRLVGNQLTPSEVTLATSRMADLIKLAEMLLQNEPIAYDIRDVIHQSLDFYPLAFLRDETLVKNSLASLAKMSPDTTGILVAGGFHTDAIADYLRQHQIAYMVVNPVISRDLTSEEQLNYVKRMCGDHVTPKEMATDIAWIQSGRRMAADGLSEGIAPSGTNQGTKTPGESGTENQFLGGISDQLRAALVKGGDELANELEKIGLSATDGDITVMAQEINPERLAAVQKHIDSLGTDLKINPALPGITLKLIDPKTGKYAVEGQNSGKTSVFTELAQDAFLASPANTAFPQTLYVQAVSDVPALNGLGAEARLIKDEDGKTASIPMALSRFKALSAFDESKPASGSVQEKKAAMAIHTYAHELDETTKAAEPTTIARGFALGAGYAAKHLDADPSDNVQNYVKAVAPQFAAGKEAPSMTNTGISNLAIRVANLFNSKELAAKNVQAVALELSKEYPQATQEEIASDLKSLEGGMEMRLAQAGYSAPLKKKLHQVIFSKVVEGMAA